MLREEAVAGQGAAPAAGPARVKSPSPSLASGARLPGLPRHGGTRMTALAPARSRWIALLAACALLAPAGAALAQAPADEKAQKPEAEAPAPEPPKILEEITVTAQKREENIQQVPLSVTTLDADQLDPPLRRRRRRQGPLGPGAEPAARVLVRPRLPALLHPRPRQHRLRPQRLAAGLDGGRRCGAGEPGAQGLAALRPAAHGGAARPAGHAVRAQHAGRHRQVRTRKPSQETDGFARVSYGTYDNVDFKAAVGGGLTETLSARVSLLYQSQSDWIDNTFTGRTTRSAASDLGRPAAAPLGAEREVQRPGQRARLGPRRHGAHVPRQHPRSPAPTSWSTASSRTRSPRTA